MSELMTRHQVMFDRLRREDASGEHWSARAIMPFLDYEKWERFEDAIQRARISCKIAGNDPDQAFSRLREEGTGGRPRTDYRLTRYGAYLLAINGDVNKPAIAAAQAYFVIQARIAETMVPQQREAPATYAESLRELAATVEARELEAARANAAEARVGELEPVAAAWEHTFRDGDDEEVADTAKWLSRDHAIRTGQQRLHHVLRELGWTYRSRGDGTLRVSQRALEAGWMVQRDAERWDARVEDWVTYVQVRITKAKGRPYLLKNRDSVERLSAEFKARPR